MRTPFVRLTPRACARRPAAPGRLLVVEEHNVIGGVASACADALVDGGHRRRRFLAAGDAAPTSTR